MGSSHESLLLLIDEYSEKESLINELENLVDKAEHPPTNQMDLVVDLQGCGDVNLTSVLPKLLPMEYTIANWGTT